MAVAYTTPEMLTWARSRCGFSEHEIAHKLNVKAENVQAWEGGEKRPTMNQARDFAKKTHIPFAYLYLDSPPELSVPVADFRSGWTKTKNLEEEVNLYDLVESILYKKEWYEDYLKRTGSNINSGVFQDSFSQSDGIHNVAKSIVEHLDLQITNKNKGRGTPKSFWQRFKNRVTEANIWLIQTSIVDSNTHRKISPKTSRGLALKSPYTPIIWVNSGLQDAPKIFTLAHELAHIWIGSEGISSSDEDTNAENQIEQFCDDVASEILVPEQLIKEKWQTAQNPEDNIERLYNYFGVSRFVVARKSYQAKLIKCQEFNNINRSLKKKAHTFGQKKELPEKNATSFYNTLIARNGRQFVEAVIDELDEDNVFIVDACNLLGFSRFSTIDGVRDHLSGNENNASS